MDCKNEYAIDSDESCGGGDDRHCHSVKKRFRAVSAAVIVSFALDLCFNSPADSFFNIQSVESDVILEMGKLG